MNSQAQLSHPNSYLQLTLLSCLEHWQVVRPAGLLGFQMLLPQSLSEHWEGGAGAGVGKTEAAGEEV